MPAALLLLLQLLLAAARLPSSQAFVLHGGQQGGAASRPHHAPPSQHQPQQAPQALQAIALGGGAGESRAAQQQHQEQHQARQAAAEAAAAQHHEAAVAGPPQQSQPQQQQQPARARWPRLFGRDLRSPFISVEVRPATRLEELMAVIDLRAECFAGQQLSVEAKLRHTKHVLARRCVAVVWGNDCLLIDRNGPAREGSPPHTHTRHLADLKSPASTQRNNRARGAVVLVATARDLLSPFSEEVVVGSLEVSTHEFEAASPFLHDHVGVPKLYVRARRFGFGLVSFCTPLARFRWAIQPPKLIQKPTNAMITPQTPHS